MQRRVEEREEPEHPPELDDRIPAGDAAQRRDGERDHEKADRPVAREVRDEFDRVRGEVALDGVVNEHRGGDERRDEGDSLEEDDALQYSFFGSIPEYIDATWSP